MRQKFIGLLLVILSFFFSIPAFAIAYSDGDDCTNLSDMTTCMHKEVVMVGGFDSAGLTIKGTRCSATLIQKPSGKSIKYVFITAAHCAADWKSNSNIVTLGISLDPNVGVEGNTVDISHFITGMVGKEMFPVTNKYFPTNNRVAKDVGILPYDYAALIYMPLKGDSLAAKWPMTTVKPAVIAQDVGLNLGDVVMNTNNPTHNIVFHGVGYGVLELVNAPGNGNSGGSAIDPTTLGTKRVANTELYQNLRKTILENSQNPALGANGTCFGDSGGPNYYVDASGNEILAAITSQGDAVCRAMGTNARIDTPDAASFITCIRNAATATQVNACGQ